MSGSDAAVATGDRQTTLGAAFERSGRGLHTGREATLTAVPAPAGSGYVFRRTDLPGRPEVPARLERVVATDRGTVLRSGDASVATVEHLLGAAYLLGLDNVVFEISGPEVPILDGSAREWVAAIRGAGLARLDAPRRVVEVAGAFQHVEGLKRLEAAPHPGFTVRYLIDYGHPALGRQEIELDLSDPAVVEGIAPARTFCFEREVQALRDAGLIRGGDLDCALVVGETGLLNGPARFPDEFVRHKVLDFLGDLALGGCRLRGAFRLERAGHGFHVASVRALLARPGATRERSPMNVPPLPLDVQAIQALLPHRFPFLFLDRITAVEPKVRATGWKQATVNEWFFQGHFPGHPIYPGVLLIEGMAQCAGVLVMLSYPETQGKLTYFMAIDNARFRKPVVPGDTLRYEVEVMKVKGPVSRLKGSVFVGEELAAEAELMCMSVAPGRG